MFSFVFDSDNSVVDIVADEMLSPISTKRHDSGSVGRFVSALISECLFNPPRARRKVGRSIIVTLMANTRCVSHRDAAVAERYYSARALSLFPESGVDKCLLHSSGIPHTIMSVKYVLDLTLVL